MDRMKDYRQLIKELPSTTLVCAFGDFDPPTTAHELLVKTVNRLSEQKNTDHVIYASTKDSLIQEEKKEQYLKLMFPKTKFKSVNESKINNLLEELGKKYKKIVIVTGSEQVDKLKKLVKENTSIQIIPITEKNPDANFAKMKQLATKGLYEQFKKKLPSNIRELDGRRLMNDVRHGLGLDPIKENLILVKDKLREQYFRGEIFNEGDNVVSNGELYTIVKRGSNHLLLREQSGNLVSKWIKDVNPKEEKEMKEGVIQPNGTDKLEVSTSDTGAKQDITKPTGKTKGFLTFYNYSVKESETSKSDKDKDSESDLDTEHQLDVYDPREIGHTLVSADDPKGSHHLRRMKIKYHTEGTDPVATERMKAQLTLKHAKEKESLAAKHTQEKENISELSNDLLARYKTASAASAKAADASGDYAKGDKRFKGINKATTKQFDNDLKKHGQMKEGYGEDDVTSHGGTVIYKKGNQHHLSNVANKTGTHVKTMSGHEVPYKHIVSTDASDWKHFRDKPSGLSEETDICPDCKEDPCVCDTGIDKTSYNQPFDPFFKEDVTEEEIDEIVNSVTDRDIEDLYEEDELVLVYDDDGEEILPLQEESKYDLMEVLSRAERIRGKMRLRKTSAKRGRSTKIALKRFSNPTTINKRARRLAIKLMKKRMLRGRDPAKISVGEKERIERAMEKRKDVVSRVAQRLVSRVRKVEKDRMSHSKVTKSSTPNVF
jgi:hypothetical protein